MVIVATDEPVSIVSPVKLAFRADKSKNRANISTWNRRSGKKTLSLHEYNVFLTESKKYSNARVDILRLDELNFNILTVLLQRI
jgi:hypothetical protein